MLQNNSAVNAATSNLIDLDNHPKLFAPLEANQKQNAISERLDAIEQKTAGVLTVVNNIATVLATFIELQTNFQKGTALTSSDGEKNNTIARLQDEILSLQAEMDSSNGEIERLYARLSELRKENEELERWAQLEHDSAYEWRTKAHSLRREIIKAKLRPYWRWEENFYDPDIEEEEEEGFLKELSADSAISCSNTATAEFTPKAIVLEAIAAIMQYNEQENRANYRLSVTYRSVQELITVDRSHTFYCCLQEPLDTVFKCMIGKWGGGSEENRIKDHHAFLNMKPKNVNRAESVIDTVEKIAVEVKKQQSNYPNLTHYWLLKYTHKLSDKEIFAFDREGCSRLPIAAY